jgi:CRP/FNR family cyclic AMP-dependent transcriptional regulator
MSDIEGVELLLKQHPFCQGMEAEMRRLLAECAMSEYFQAGQYLFREGMAADRFYLIRHGDVALEVHVPGREPVIVETLHEGDILGWSWLVPPYKWLVDARAAQLVRAISVNADHLRARYERDHSLAYELFRRFIPIMAYRLEAGKLQMIDIYGKVKRR